MISVYRLLAPGICASCHGETESSTIVEVGFRHRTPRRSSLCDTCRRELAALLTGDV